MADMYESDLREKANSAIDGIFNGLVDRYGPEEGTNAFMQCVASALVDVARGNSGAGRAAERATQIIKLADAWSSEDAENTKDGEE